YAYISALRAQGVPAKLIIGQRYKARVSIKKLYRLSREDNTQFMLLPQQLDFEKEAKRLLNRLPEKRKVILHCRNIEAAYIGWLVHKENPNIKVLYDVRGYVEDEMRFFGDPTGEEKYKKLNKQLFNAPIYFNFVSHKLREVYEEKYQVKFKNYTICVSAYNDQVFKLNHNSIDYKIQHKHKVVFVGGSQPYQRIESLVELLEKQDEVDFTVVTHKKISIPNAKNTRFLYGLTPKQVSQVLDQMNYGILYRSREAFNEVATPTKIAEYWGKGLKVIAINSAGAYTPIIQENPFLGYVFKDEEAYLKEHLSKPDFEEKQKISS